MKKGSRLVELIGAAPRFLALLGRMMADDRVSRTDRAIVAAAVLYAFSPIDLIPDSVPLLGHLDDFYLIAFAIDRMVRRTDPEVVRTHWRGSPDLLDTFESSLGHVARLVPRAVERELGPPDPDR